MSKLLEMLRKSRGEIAETVVPLIDAEIRGTPEVGAGFKSEGTSSGIPAAATTVGPPPLEAPSIEAPLLAVRTMSLRVPAPSPLLPFDNNRSRSSEQYRILRTRINHYPNAVSLIVITSPDPGDGKSVTAINTAAALALKSEGRVLLLDADLRRSTIHLQLGLPESPGLADVLAGACAPEQAMVHTQEFPNLYVMSAGTPKDNPVELLGSMRLRSLCTQLRGLFQYVIIDSPPVGGVADYDLIQAACDGVILVLRPDSSNRDRCWNALELISKDKFMGTVLNCIPDWSPGQTAASSYYYYSRAKGSTTD